MKNNWGEKQKWRASCLKVVLWLLFLPHHTTYLLVICLSGSNLKCNIVLLTLQKNIQSCHELEGIIPLLLVRVQGLLIKSCHKAKVRLSCGWDQSTLCFFPCWGMRMRCWPWLACAQVSMNGYMGGGFYGLQWVEYISIWGSKIAKSWNGGLK